MKHIFESYNDIKKEQRARKQLSRYIKIAAVPLTIAATYLAIGYSNKIIESYQKENNKLEQKIKTKDMKKYYQNFKKQNPY